MGYSSIIFLFFSCLYTGVNDKNNLDKTKISLAVSVIYIAYFISAKIQQYFISNVIIS
jgi:hypothetical protein